MAYWSLLFFLGFSFPRLLTPERPHAKVLTWGYVILFLFLCFQWFYTSQDPHSTGLAVIQWTALFVLLMMTQSLRWATLKRLCFFVMLVALLNAGYGLFSVLSGAEDVLWRSKESHLGYVTGTYMNRNHFAGLLEMALGISLGFCIESFKRKQVLNLLFFVGCFLFLFYALLRSGSRMGLVSALAAFLFLFFLILLRKKKQVYLLLWLSVLLGLCVFMGFFLFKTVWWRFWNELGLFTFVSVERLQLWKDALLLLQSHPWAGIGLGSFAYVFPQMQSESLLWAYSHAHQDYLELLLELGIPVALMIFGAFFYLGIAVIKELRSAQETYFGFFAGVFFAVLALCFHGLADFNFAIPANLLIWIFLVSILIKFVACRSEENKASC